MTGSLAFSQFSEDFSEVTENRKTTRWIIGRRFGVGKYRFTHLRDVLLASSLQTVQSRFWKSGMPCTRHWKAEPSRIKRNGPRLWAYEVTISAEMSWDRRQQLGARGTTQRAQ